jgi:hypothetical protein
MSEGQAGKNEAKIHICQFRELKNNTAINPLTSKTRLLIFVATEKRSWGVLEESVRVYYHPRLVEMAM